MSCYVIILASHHILLQSHLVSCSSHEDSPYIRNWVMDIFQLVTSHR